MLPFALPSFCWFIFSNFLPRLFLTRQYTTMSAPRPILGMAAQAEMAGSLLWSRRLAPLPTEEEKEQRREEVVEEEARPRRLLNRAAEQQEQEEAERELSSRPPPRTSSPLLPPSAEGEGIFRFDLPIIASVSSSDSVTNHTIHTVYLLPRQ